MAATKAYEGSCHCGQVKYQIRLNLPPDTTSDRTAKTARLYKCNCSTCKKQNMFHCRPIDCHEDFVLTSPATIEELGCYRAFTGKVGWYFCKNCGVKTFGAGGNWEQEDLDVGKWAGREGNDGNVQKVWRSTALKDTPGFDGKPLHYLSVNAVTLDGVDLIEWHDKKWIFYVENIHREERKMPEMRFSEPFPGGCY